MEKPIKAQSIQYLYTFQHASVLVYLTDSACQCVFNNRPTYILVFNATLYITMKFCGIKK